MEKTPTVMFGSPVLIRVQCLACRQDSAPATIADTVEEVRGAHAECEAAAETFSMTAPLASCPDSHAPDFTPPEVGTPADGTLCRLWEIQGRIAFRRTFGRPVVTAVEDGHVTVTGWSVPADHPTFDYLAAEAAAVARAVKSIPT